MTKFSIFKSEEDGAAAVEFAILVPVLLMITFGIIYFGFLFGVSHSLQLVAAEATRASVRGVTMTERLQLAETAFDDAISKSPLLDPSRVEAVYQQTSVPFTGLVVTVTYNLEGTLADSLPIVSSSAGSSIVREAFIAY